jgi:hypothetical protein
MVISAENESWRWKRRGQMGIAASILRENGKNPETDDSPITS